MITDLPDEFKTQLINNRLSNLSRQYFESQMDKAQAESSNNAQDVQRATDRMAELEKAYAAIQALLPTTVA